MPAEQQKTTAAPDARAAAAQTTPFHDLDAFVALPRVEALALSPDGQRAVLTVATLSADRTTYRRALWAVAADGSGAPARLTRSAKGESGCAFTASGDVLFVSGRPDAEADSDDDAAQLWLLPEAGGEARAVTRLTGGVGGIAATARAADTVVISAGLLPSSASEADVLTADAALRKVRGDRKVTAVLHDRYPIRYWDHDLGPDEQHLLALDLGSDAEKVAAAAPLVDAVPAPVSGGELGSGSGTDAGASTGTSPGQVPDAKPYPPELPRPVDLTPAPGPLLADTAGQALTPDGATLIASLQVPEQRGGRYVIASIDVSTGERRVLFDEPEVDFENPVVSRSGERIAFLRSERSTPAGPRDLEIWVADIDGGRANRVAAEWDRWATSLLFDLGDDALIVTADHDGRGPVFRIPLGEDADAATAPATVQRLTDDEFAYTHVSLDERTGDLVALRSSWLAPSHPVRIPRPVADDAGALTPTEVLTLATPAPLPEVPATMTEVETTAADGARVRGWLVLPSGLTEATAAPLLLWIHGGPLNSWNAWSWRWSPVLAAARGYAVLLPDPALSTGYGLDFIARGWDSWGQAPFTDLMAITDAVVARDDIDETRTAAMGGSFGGYMANWVAGHADRFDAIVTHASLWALDQFAGTTDSSDYWQSIFSAEGMRANSPHTAVADISTPMLVIHGDHDYRVPIGEGLRLWSELAEHHAGPDGSTEHRLLLFPDENHWVLKPQHAVVWYETVFAFLEQHVLGGEWTRPGGLG